uniref:Uncharacterized protein n=1 Tax=Chelydra serpentina TaxID=8475 RepID=A0A8C3TDC8_CHESE
INEPSYPRDNSLHGLFHLMVRMSLKLKICLNRSPTGRSPNHFIRGDPRNYSSLISLILRWIQHTNIHNNTRTNIPYILLMTINNNMIYLYTSRN